MPSVPQAPAAALQWHPDKCHPPPELHGEAAAEYTAVTEQVSNPTPQQPGR